MNITVILGKNLLDMSKIQEAIKILPGHIVTGSSAEKVKQMMRSGPGDRSFTIILDYYLYENSDINDFVDEINGYSDEYKIKNVHYESFVPHEKIPDLQKAHPDVLFIARSAFFRDIAQFIHN